MSIAVSTRNIISIGELNQRVRNLLEGEFPAIWVEGEISNLVKPSSGHLYFTLKDSNAQVRAAMFKGNNRFLTFTPRNGTQVMVRCRVSLYAPRGDYQIIVDSMEESGEGALRRAYEQLKQKLAVEGLFEQEYKQDIPSHPQTVGIVTSPTGAAIRDILTVFKRRFPATEIVLFPSMVQGEGSAQNIARMIEKANQLKNCDVLIVGRGGGSLEDLWAFNEEIVARAVFASTIPVISAVGHEIDFTIADLVADMRAATPSAAAELLSPDQLEYHAAINSQAQQLSNLMRDKILANQQHLGHLQKRLKHPGQTLQEQVQRLDMLESRLKNALQFQLSQQNSTLENCATRLRLNSPQLQFGQQLENIQQLNQRLGRSMEHMMLLKQQALQSNGQRLDALSPLATLSRGYSITRKNTNTHKKLTLIKHFSDVKIGDSLCSEVSDGTIYSTVTETSPNNSLYPDKDIDQ